MSKPKEYRSKPCVIPSEFEVREVIIFGQDLKQLAYVFVGIIVAGMVFLLFRGLPFFIGYFLALIPVAIGLVGTLRLDGRSLVDWGVMYILFFRKPHHYVWQSLPQTTRTGVRGRVISSRVPLEEVESR